MIFLFLRSWWAIQLLSSELHVGTKLLSRLPILSYIRLNSFYEYDIKIHGKSIDSENSILKIDRTPIFYLQKVLKLNWKSSIKLLNALYI